MSFGDFFWAMFWICLVFIPLLAVWLFSIADVFTREMSGWVKAIWLCAIVFLPFVGTLLYLIVRPGKAPSYAYSYAPAPTYAPQPYAPQPYAGQPTYAPPPAAASTPVDQLQQLSALHDDGKLTDAEFASAKARIVGPIPTSAPTTNPAAAA